MNMLEKINQLANQLEKSTQLELTQFMEEYEEFRNEVIYNQSKKEIGFSVNFNFIETNEFKVFSSKVSRRDTALVNKVDKKGMKELLMGKANLDSVKRLDAFLQAS